MITYYHKTTPSSKLQILERYKEGSWIYLESPEQKDLEAISKEFDLDLSIIEDVLDEDEMPRLHFNKDVSYLFSRFAYVDDHLHITTTPVLFVLHPKTLITITLKPLANLDKFKEEKVEYTTSSGSKLLLQVIDQLVDHYELTLNSISRQVKAIQSRLRVEEINNKDFIDFVLLEDILNEFLSALVPTNAILQRLLNGKHMKLKKEDEELVKDLLLNNEQSIEGCKATLKTIVNIREAYSTIMTNNLNRVMRVLTVLTTILAVPTLIASIYGMNINLPFNNSEFAFGGIMLFSIAISLILLLFFKYRRWL